MKRYSEEKWVDAPNQQAASSQEPAQKQSQRFSEGSGGHSQKSYNNFTFFEKQTSLKDSKQKNSEASNIKMSNLKAQFGMSSEPERVPSAQDLQKLQKLYLNNIDVDNSSNQSYKYQHINLPFKVRSQKGSPPKMDVQEQKRRSIQLHEENPALHAGAISSRSGRSGRSGIMAQLNGLAHAGGLRGDNELFYPHLLNQNQPPFTAIESHRSMNSNQTFNLNMLNQELPVPGHPAGRRPQEVAIGEVAGAAPGFDPQLKGKFFTAENKGLKDSRQPAGYDFQLRDSSSANQFKTNGSGTQQTNPNHHAHIPTSSERRQMAQQLLPQPENRREGQPSIPERPHEELFPADPQIPEAPGQGKSPQELTELDHGEGSESAEMEEEFIEVSQKISNINMDKTIDSKSIPMSGHLSNDPGSTINKKSQSQTSLNQFKQYQMPQNNSMPQSLLSLHTHKSHSQHSSQHSDPSKQELAREFKHSSRNQNALMTDLNTLHKNDTENGPTTLISHLNDPNHEVITHNEEDEDSSSIQRQSEALKYKLTQQISPLETCDKNELHDIEQKPLSVPLDMAGRASGGGREHNQVTAENLMKYLENKWNEKKQESSSLFDHSRASMQSDQKIQQATRVGNEPGAYENREEPAREAAPHPRSAEEDEEDQSPQASLIDHDSIQLLVDQ